MFLLLNAYAEGVLPLPDKWFHGTANGHNGMLMDGNAFIGFKDPDPAAKRLSYSAVKLLPQNIEGDFIATAKLKYETKDGNFVGNGLIQILDTNGFLLAETGLRDHWCGAQGRIHGAVSGSNVTPNQINVPYDGKLELSITRIGSMYSISGNNQIVLKAQGNANSVGKVMLFFDTYQDNPDAHFGRLEFSDIEVKPYTIEDIPAFQSFNETPKTGFSPEWKLVSMTGAAGLSNEAGAQYYTITGFDGIDAAEKQTRLAIYERSLGNLSGDFTATLDMDWILPKDKSFMGEVLLQLYTVKGELAAEAGILDQWYTGNAHAAGWIGPERKGDAIWIADICDDPFVITRKGDEFTIHCGSWQLDGGKGTTDPIVTARLAIRQYLYQDKDGKDLSKFGRIAIRRLAIEDKALPPPAPRVTPVPEKKQWEIGKPIIWYWAGPEVSEEQAKQLADGGWNVAWGYNVHDLDIMYKYGIRGVLWVTIDINKPENQKRLKWWVESFRNHPAIYGVHCGDEPGGERMDASAKSVNFFSELAPGLLHFNNMYPINASNMQLGHEGTAIVAYKSHIEEYFQKLKPQLLSYDKYNLWFNGDDPSYFINSVLIRQTALKFNVPQLHIVQGCAYISALRPPSGDEYRFLAYTSLAYGSQGLSNYVYGYPGHWGSALDPETGKTTPLYDAMSSINREFVAIASELQPLKSLAVWHAGTIPFGVDAYPDNAAFDISPKVNNIDQGLVEAKVNYAADNNFYTPSEPVQGWILGCFGTDDKVTHMLLVNPDYHREHEVTFSAPGKLEQFNQFTGKWKKLGRNSARVKIAKGSGILFRLAKGSSPLLKKNAQAAEVTILPPIKKTTAELDNGAMLDDFTKGELGNAWQHIYHRNCDDLNLEINSQDGLVINGLKNSKENGEAWLARVTPFIEGDFTCEIDMTLPADAPLGQNTIAFKLCVPNGESMIGIQIDASKMIKALVGWNGKVSFQNTVTAPKKSGILRITRRGDVFTVSWNDDGLFIGTGDISAIGNFKIEAIGENSSIHIKQIRIHSINK